MFQDEEKDSPRARKRLVVCSDACNQGPERVTERTIGQVKVQWKHYSPDEATWELEDAMRVAYPFLFNFEEH